MSAPRVLVAGIGNVFLGDDGFGVEVARALAMGALPPAVQVVDFGIRGIDLVYALLEPFDLVILVDTMKRGGSPGDLYVVEPGEASGPGLETHEMSPERVLAAAAAMGAKLNNVLIVGCEPDSFGTEDEPRMGLSAVVLAAVPEALVLIESLAVKARAVVHS